MEIVVHGLLFNSRLICLLRMSIIESAAISFLAHEAIGLEVTFDNKL